MISLVKVTGLVDVVGMLFVMIGAGSTPPGSRGTTASAWVRPLIRDRNAHNGVIGTMGNGRGTPGATTALTETLVADPRPALVNPRLTLLRATVRLPPTIPLAMLLSTMVAQA